MTAKAEFVFLEDEVTFLDVVAPNVDSVTVHEIEVKWQENSFCHSSSEKMEALNKRSFQHKALPIKWNGFSGNKYLPIYETKSPL